MDLIHSQTNEYEVVLREYCKVAILTLVSTWGARVAGLRGQT